MAHHTYDTIPARRDGLGASAPFVPKSICPEEGPYMLTRQKDLLGRFVGVQEFLDCNDGVLGTINQSGGPRGSG